MIQRCYGDTQSTLVANNCTLSKVVGPCMRWLPPQTKHVCTAQTHSTLEVSLDVTGGHDVQSTCTEVELSTVNYILSSANTPFVTGQRH